MIHNPGREGSTFQVRDRKELCSSNFPSTFQVREKKMHIPGQKCERRIQISSKRYKDDEVFPGIKDRKK